MITDLFNKVKNAQSIMGRVFDNIGKMDKTVMGKLSSHRPDPMKTYKALDPNVQEINPRSITPSRPIGQPAPQVKDQFLGRDKDYIVKLLAGIESASGTPAVFSKERQKLAQAPNAYDDWGKYGWVYGITIPTVQGFINKANKGDKRYQELVKKINTDTMENAGQSAYEIWKFKNQAHDESGTVVGPKFTDLRESYLNVYNASDNKKTGEDGLTDRQRAARNFDEWFAKVK